MNPRNPQPAPSLDSTPSGTTPPEPSTLDSQLPPVIPDHQLLRRIGSGSYGEVWLGRSITGAWRAVKVVYRKSFEQSACRPWPTIWAYAWRCVTFRLEQVNGTRSSTDCSASF